MATGTITKVKDFLQTGYLRSGDDLNDLYNSSDSGTYYISTGVANSPIEWGVMLVIVNPNANSGAAFQLIWKPTEMYFRGRTGSPLTWRAWQKVTSEAIS